MERGGGGHCWKGRGHAPAKNIGEEEGRKDEKVDKEDEEKRR